MRYLKHFGARPKQPQYPPRVHVVSIQNAMMVMVEDRQGLTQWPVRIRFDDGRERILWDRPETVSRTVRQVAARAFRWIDRQGGLYGR